MYCAIDLCVIGTYFILMSRMQTVVELPEFIRRASEMMTEADRLGLVDYIAANPEAGVSLGGGLRKVRLPRAGSGKSGGYRTVYVFGGTHMPIFLLTVFAKKEKDNLSKKELSAAVQLSKALIDIYGEKR
jgi:hypothetical protein